MGQTLSAILQQQQQQQPYHFSHQRFFTVGNDTQLYLRDTRLDQLSCFHPNSHSGRFEAIVHHIVHGLLFRVHSLVDHAPIDVHVDGSSSPVQEHHTLIRLQLQDNGDPRATLFVDPRTLAHFFTPFSPNDPRHLEAPESWSWHHTPDIRHQDGRRLLRHQRRAQRSPNAKYLSSVDNADDEDDDDDDTDSLYSVNSNSSQQQQQRARKP